MSVQVSCHECDGDGVVGSHTHNPDTERVSVDPLVPCPNCGGSGIRWDDMGAACPCNVLEPVVDCPRCGDDAEHASAPGPNEPIDEYDCLNCGHQFRRPPISVADLGMTHDEFRELVKTRVRAMVADA